MLKETYVTVPAAGIVSKQCNSQSDDSPLVVLLGNSFPISPAFSAPTPSPSSSASAIDRSHLKLSWLSPEVRI